MTTRAKEGTFVKQQNSDGTTNSSYTDVLDVDKPIANQTFACVSFVSPESVLKQKNVFIFEKFINQYHFSKSMEKYHQFLNYISYKYNLSNEHLLNDFKEFSQEEIDDLKDNQLNDDFKNFLDVHEDHLEKEFSSDHDFQTSVRGLKIRGVYPTQGEAELRCKMLREVDPNHDVYVGPVGTWMPWEPEAYKTGRVEYMEEELNQLMQEKIKNQQTAKMHFENRLAASKNKAIEENVLSAEKNNITLSQDIDEEGNLVTVGKNTQEEAFLTSGEAVSIVDIQSELFDGDNIVTDTKNDRGLGQLNLGENDK